MKYGLMIFNIDVGNVSRSKTDKMIAEVKEELDESVKCNYDLLFLPIRDSLGYGSNVQLVRYN